MFTDANLRVRELRRCVSGGLAVLIALMAGCTFLRKGGAPRKAEVKSLQLGTNSLGAPQTVRSLQIEVARFADNYAALVAYACDEFSVKMVGPQARLAAAQWKLEQATAAYINASGPNPIINALDMVVLATASRMVIRDVLKQRADAAEAAETLVDAHQKLETNAWSLVSGFLTAAQLQDVRDLIGEWRRNNPEERNVTTLRFRQFLGALEQTEARATGAPSSFFSLLFLDPMASMDPATAAIEQTRNTAERAMYYTQRMPSLLNWQVELLTYSLVVQPEAKQLLSDTERITKVTEALAKTADSLPQLIDQQREAAIKQVLEGLVPEQAKASNILVQAREAASEARKALEAGNATAVTVQGTIRTLQEFVQIVSKTNEFASTNRKPFDVMEYAMTAGAIGSAAKDVSTMLASANDSASQLAQLRQQTIAEVNTVVDRAFLRALLLVGALVVGGLLAGVLFRLASRRLDRRP